MPAARPQLTAASRPRTAAENDAQTQNYVDDRTVFRPNPAGRRPPGPGLANAATDPAGRPAPPPAPRQSAVQGLELGAPNENPIMQAAGPLLLLLGRLRTALLRAPAPGLAAQIAAAIEKCDRDMNAAGVAPKEANTAKYVLCATADEVLANLPGEDRGAAARSGLMTRFFGENNGGRRFFDELDRVKADAKAHYQLLELFHACLALGFQGAHQTLPGGAATLQDIRHDLYELLQKARPTPPRDLSPRWRGQPLASHAVRLRIPLWTAAGVIGLLLFGAFIGMRLSLGHRAEAAAESLTTLNPQTPVAIGRKIAVAPPPPPTPTPAQATQLDHIRKVLEPNIAAGALNVESTVNQIVIHITDRVLFQPGKAAVLEDVRPLIMYIALALDDDKGAIKVVGHSDNKPISNARFASNFELSLERAKVVGALLKQSLSHPERVETEGKGADVPIASNDTVEGRNKNRRVEIVVPRSD
jgi:type VI secretion system protein ImpK